MGGSLFFLFFCHWRQLSWRTLPPPSPPEPSEGRARICFRFPVSLLSLLGGGAGGADRVVLSWFFVFSSFFGVLERHAHPFWGEKGVPAKCIIPKSLPSFPSVSVNYIPRTLASRGLEELSFQLCCCVSFWFWREIGFGFTYLCT